MIRLLFLLAGTVVLVVLLWQLGPADILRMIVQLGWHSLPILVCYAFYQVMRIGAYITCCFYAQIKEAMPCKT